MSHPEFKDRLTIWWKIKVEGTTMYRLVKKLDEVKINLKIWNKKVFKNMNFRKIHMKEELEKLKNELLIIRRTRELDKVKNILLTNFYNTISQEEQLWRQKSRVTWLKEGDKNTKFFKITTIRRRSYNRINEIKRMDGVLTLEEKEIK